MTLLWENVVLSHGKNKMEYFAEYSGKIKSVFFVERGTLCDSAVTD